MGKGRILAIGDIHGCDTAFATLLSELNIQPDDTLVFVGDAVDRGPNSKAVVDRIIRLQESCKVVFIMGNHEEMLKAVLEGHGLLNQWLSVGGQATVDSYGESVDNIPSEHIRFLSHMMPYWESDREIFVHASLEPQVSLMNQTSDFLRWKSLGGLETPHVSGKRVICGHTAQIDGVPLVLDGWVCIDTFAYGGKWLTALDVASNDVVQASESGEVRSFHLSKYK
jgi:serine/threonine protein phosphatase 1